METIVQNFLSWEVLIVGLISFITMSFIQKAAINKSVLKFWKRIAIFLIPFCVISFFRIHDSFIVVSSTATALLSGFFLLFVLAEEATSVSVKIRRNLFIFFVLTIGLLNILISYWAAYIASILGFGLGLLTIYFWRNRDRKRMKLHTKVHYSVI